MRKFKDKLLFTMCVITAFVCGSVIESELSQPKFVDTVKINEQEVKIVDFMYTYEKDGEVIEGDYSLVSDQGWEYSTSSRYENLYTNAKIVQSKNRKKEK